MAKYEQESFSSQEPCSVYSSIYLEKLEYASDMKYFSPFHYLTVV